MSKVIHIVYIFSELISFSSIRLDKDFFEIPIVILISQRQSSHLMVINLRYTTQNSGLYSVQSCICVASHLFKLVDLRIDGNRLVTEKKDKRENKCIS